MSNMLIDDTNSKRISLGNRSEAVTGVNLYVGKDDSGNDIAYVAGDSTGFVLNASSPVGTQSMANNILSAVKLRGFRYQAFEATSLLDPAAEVGDTATVNNNGAVIHNASTKHSTLMESEVSAPYDEEINHEYRYESKQERTFRRQIGEVKATLSIQAGEIAAKVSATGGDNQSFGWSMTTAGMFWYANGSEIMRATKDGLKVTGEIVATSGNIGGATIVNGVLTVENANIGSINGSKVVDNTLNGSKIYDGSISSGKYGTGSIYGGSGGSIADSTISTANTVSGINTSLGYADFANGVFSGFNTASYMKTSALIVNNRQYTPGTISFVDGNHNTRTFYTLLYDSSTD